MIDPITGTTAAVEETSKAAGKFADLLASFGIFEKRRIIRRAEGEAEASLVATNAEITRAELLERYAFVREARQARRQQNLETITSEAKDQLPEDPSDEPIDPDWFARFMNECQDISNEELQNVWARLLSQEAARPGRCHPSTLSILGTLTASDARLFAQVASFAVGTPVRNVLVPADLLNAAARVADYSDALTLSDLGLMQLHSGVFTTLSPGNVIEYDGRGFVRRDADVRFQSYPLTRAGIDLYAVVQPAYLPEVETWLVDHLGMEEIAMPSEVPASTVAGSPRHADIPPEQQDE